MPQERDNNFFGDEIVFEYSWKMLSNSQIDELITEFPGKEEFKAFYLTHNGGIFTKRAFFYPHNYYNLSKDYELIEIGSFLHLSPLEDDEKSNFTISIEEEIDRRNYSDDFEDFILFNIPFAINDADNDFWIDIQSGEIKYVDYSVSYDPNNAIIIAPSFSDFCKNIKANRK